jgi:hypothetical protein
MAGAVAGGLVHWRGMLTARRLFDKNSPCGRRKKLSHTEFSSSTNGAL